MIKNEMKKIILPLILSMAGNLVEAKNVRQEDLGRAFPRTAYTIFLDKNNDGKIQENEIFRNKDNTIPVTDNYFKAKSWERDGYQIAVIKSEKEFRYVFRSDGVQEFIYDVLTRGPIDESFVKRYGGADSKAWFKKYENSKELSLDELTDKLQSYSTILVGEAHFWGEDEQLELIYSLGRRQRLMLGHETASIGREEKIEKNMHKKGKLTLLEVLGSYSAIADDRIINYTRDNGHIFFPLDFNMGRYEPFESELIKKAEKSEIFAYCTLRNLSMIYQTFAASKTGLGQVVSVTGMNHTIKMYENLSGMGELGLVFFDPNFHGELSNLPPKKGIYQLEKNLFIVNTLDKGEHMKVMERLRQ